MDHPFRKPQGLIGKFAIIKLWPKLKAAEDENVARLKVTAKSLGLECIEITPDGRLLEAPRTRLTGTDVDFAIHLHFETPKAYDIFSFVALWNPVQFYFDWGYRRFSRHLLTHDDFLSCSATATDDHICRMIATDPQRVGPLFTMYHSLSEPILEPTLGDHKIFYAGINWERLGKKKGRHQELLNLLDTTGSLRIFGPKIFQGVDVWEGYQSYSGSIPFDGVSLIKEINRSGIALVLSSDAHKESELMSNRLFESLAGGAVIICDENPFAKRHFGDTLLYIDASAPTADVFAAVQKHVKWINENPEAALKMARDAQKIFRDRFSLDRSLANIYTNLADRRASLERLYAPSNPNQAVTLLMLMPQYDPAVLDRHIASAKTQRQAGCQAILLIDDAAYKQNGDAIGDAVNRSGVEITITPVPFFDRDAAEQIRKRVPLGRLISDAIKTLPPDTLLCVVAPDEELFAEHIQALAGALERDPAAAVAYSDIIYRHQSDGNLHHDLHEELDYISYATNRPLGYGRFLFRLSALPQNIHSALRYVDVKAIALLVAAAPSRIASRRASIISDIQSSFNVDRQPNLQVEFEVMRDYSPSLLAPARPTDGMPAVELEPTTLSLSRLSDSNRTRIAVELAHSIPMPSFLNKIFFGGYRRWLRRSK
jgi:hypothetical protein